jgi:hypothetical protein
MLNSTMYHALADIGEVMAGELMANAFRPPRSGDRHGDASEGKASYSYLILGSRLEGRCGRDRISDEDATGLGTVVACVCNPFIRN